MNKRGWRILPIYRYLWLIFHCLLLLPFLVIIGLFIYFVSYPTLATQTPVTINNYFIAIGLPILGLVSSNVVVYAFMQAKKMNGILLRVQYLDILANMLVDQGWVEYKKNSQGKDRLKFPKVYFRLKETEMSVSFETKGGKHHDRFLKAGKLLEEIFLADLTEEIREFGFVKFVYTTNVEQNRITIQDCVATKSSIQLMKHIKWRFDEVPHMLITGGTGGGKTYFIFSLILAFLKVATIDICDPKKSDLADLEDYPAFRGHVFYKTVDEMSECLKRAWDLMEQRYINIKELDNYQSGKNYAYYGLPPHFVIFDEWGAFYSMLDYRQKEQVGNYVKQIVLKGRQAGVFLIIATQRPDAEMFPSGVRDNLGYRVSLGKLSTHGYTMTFGDEHKNKVFYNKNLKGRGYIYEGAGTPQEFYAPFVPSDFDFQKAFRAFTSMIGDSQESQVEKVKEEKKQDESLSEKDLDLLAEEFMNQSLDESTAKVLPKEDEIEIL